MIKIAHFADIHWRSLTRHEEYRRSFEDAFKKLQVLQPDVILIAGDIVHSKTQGISPEIINNLTWWFRNLAEIAEVRITLGNHDGLILNPDREDAISPIISALNDPRIVLHKKSGVYPLDERHNLCVFSCFDEISWNQVVPEKEKTNIATFHGPVLGSKTDESWAIESELKDDFFNGFDYVLLGDIHKQQFLTDRIAYCGSTIQQNYGEDPGKGFLFWGIDGDDFKVKFVEVHHEFPFVTLNYDGDIDSLQAKVEECPERSRFRIRIQQWVTQAEMTQIRAAIKDVATPEEIVFKREADDAALELSKETLEEAKGIDSFDAVNALVKDYYSKSDLSRSSQNSMSSMLSNIWNSTKIADNVSNGRWSIRRIDFDNIFGYGADNTVNFDSATGITGIFGKNRSGKSSICGALSYALFNGSDRGAMKNIHIVNARKNYCKAKVIISKKGNNYLIERQTVKKTNRRGQVNASTHLNLFQCDDTGTPLRDLTEEQRRETEKLLRSIVGNLEDFLLTSLACQGDINRFVSHGPAVRKSILAKFLRLDILDALHEQVRQELSVAKASLKKVPERQFDVQIVDRTSKIKARKSERDAETEALEKITQILNSLNLSLESQGDEIYTQTEVDDQTAKVNELSTEIRELRVSKEVLETRKETLQTALDDLRSAVEEINFDHLREVKNQIGETERSLLEIKIEIETKASSLKSDKREVKKLSDVPCGEAFPACKYIISARKAEKSLLEKQEGLKSSRKYASSLKSALKKMMREDVDKKLDQKRDHDEKIYHLTQEISKCDLSLLGTEGRIVNCERDLRNFDAILNRMKVNLCSSESAQERDLIVRKRKIAEEKLTEAKKKIEFLSERVGLLTAEIDQLRRDKACYEENNQDVYVLSLLQRALSRDGIPLQIVKRKLPVINREIANILQGVTGFTVELVSDNPSGMDVILDYGDSSRVIECCSGMEKMMASLAIRTALSRVSSLPKSDMLIIDEGFGALDASNIESCTALLRSLTKTFRSILIISHVDTVKDVVDNVIEISTSKGHDSQVKFF